MNFFLTERLGLVKLRPCQDFFSSLLESLFLVFETNVFGLLNLKAEKSEGNKLN